MKKKPDSLSNLQNKVTGALEIVFTYAQIDGGHHKAWVIDQMVRKLIGTEYEKWVKEFKEGEDGPETYSWDAGIAP